MPRQATPLCPRSSPPGWMSVMCVTPSGRKVPQAMIRLPAAVRPSSSGTAPEWSRAASTRACKAQFTHVAQKAA